MRLTKFDWIYFGFSLFLVVGYPALLFLLMPGKVPFYLMLPVLLGIGLIVGRANALWVDIVSHKSDHTKDLDYPDPTIADMTGIRYREEREHVREDYK